MPRILTVIAALALFNLGLIAMVCAKDPSFRTLWRAKLARTRRHLRAFAFRVPVLRKWAAKRLRERLARHHRPALPERLRAGRDGYEYTPMPAKRSIPIAVKMAEPKRGKPKPYELDEPVRGLRQVTVHNNRVVPIEREVA